MTNKMKKGKCECGHDEFVYHREKRWYKPNHWHCKKCRKQYDDTGGEVDDGHRTIADCETWDRR